MYNRIWSHRLTTLSPIHQESALFSALSQNLRRTPSLPLEVIPPPGGGNVARRPKGAVCGRPKVAALQKPAACISLPLEGKVASGPAGRRMRWKTQKSSYFRPPSPGSPYGLGGLSRRDRQRQSVRPCLLVLLMQRSPWGVGRPTSATCGYAQARRGR